LHYDANAKNLLPRSIDRMKAMKLQKVGRIIRFLLKIYFDYLSAEQLQQMDFSYLNLKFG